jgi:hypothetical protein
VIAVQSDVEARIREVRPYCRATHYVIHRDMLAARKMSVELKSVLSEVVKVINFVKFTVIVSAYLSLISEDTGSLHQQLF